GGGSGHTGGPLEPRGARLVPARSLPPLRDLRPHRAALRAAGSTRVQTRVAHRSVALRNQSPAGAAHRLPHHGTGRVVLPLGGSARAAGCGGRATVRRPVRGGTGGGRLHILHSASDVTLGALSFAVPRDP